MKQKPIRSPKHLAFVRTKPCMIVNDEGENCNGQARSHHLTFLKGKRGIGQKVSDEWCIPICDKHHYHLHYIGEKFFWGSHGFTLDKIINYAIELWEKSNVVLA